jgi:acyl-CoA thioesterase
MSQFATDTAVDAVRDVQGAYRAVVTENWSAPILPQGGVVTAIALRAMSMELAVPAHLLRTVTTVFAGQVPPGPVDVDVTLLRRGKTMSQATATVRSVGSDAGHTSVAVFGVTRPGFEFTDLVMPEVPSPERCRSYRDPPEGFAWPNHATFFDQIEQRAALGHMPWDDFEPTTSENASWMRFDDPPRLDDGSLDPLALVVLGDTMPGAVGHRMGPMSIDWFGPSADLTVHILRDTGADWLLTVNRARHAGDGYASVEKELWDPEQGLVAYATQMSFFSFPGGPPVKERLKPEP